MARRTPKYPVGLKNDDKNTNKRNSISNDVWKRSSCSSRNRTNDLSNFNI
jgi:hypothetical protein